MTDYNWNIGSVPTSVCSVEPIMYINGRDCRKKKDLICILRINIGARIPPERLLHILLDNF